MKSLKAISPKKTPQAASNLDFSIFQSTTIPQYGLRCYGISSCYSANQPWTSPRVISLRAQHFRQSVLYPNMPPSCRTDYRALSVVHRLRLKSLSTAIRSGTPAYAGSYLFQQHHRNAFKGPNISTLRTLDSVLTT